MDPEERERACIRAYLQDGVGEARKLCRADGSYDEAALAALSQELTMKILAPVPAEIGQSAPGRGVYIGIWAPRDREGKSLNRVFNLFAAPYDLGLDEQGNGRKLLSDYNGALKAVSELRGLMGHDGAAYQNDAALYEALRSGAYKGEWFIPPLDIVGGYDEGWPRNQHDTLFRHKDKGKLKSTFVAVKDFYELQGRHTKTGTDDYCYTSCTEHKRIPSGVWGVSFLWIYDSGNSHWENKESRRSSNSTRLIRVEPV